MRGGAPRGATRGEAKEGVSHEGKVPYGDMSSAWRFMWFGRWMDEILGFRFWGAVRSSCRLGSCAMPFVYLHPRSVMPEIAMSKDTFLRVS